MDYEYLLCMSFLHHRFKFVRDQQLRKEERKQGGAEEEL